MAIAGDILKRRTAALVTPSGPRDAMDRFAPLLLNVWREACRHTEIGEAVRQAAPMLFERQPVELVIIRRFDVERQVVETAATGVCRPSIEPQHHRDALDEASFVGLLDWCQQKSIWHGEGPRFEGLPAGALPADLEGEFIVGPLHGVDGPVGLAAFGTRRPRHFQDKHLEMAGHLLEPFAVWLENDRRQRELRMLREAAEADNRRLLSRLGRDTIIDTVIGAQTGLRHVMQSVEQVARTDVPVLILGETGSGKEVVARSIHERSPRTSGPFLRVNCGAIPPELIDSELFGHERGSFTGATGQRRGWFERADGGTLLLDECGELTPAAQVRLLRILQDGTFERVGGETPITVNVRVIAATHRDLEAMTADGSFRRDLWYRLAVFPIRLPALRERREDIVTMARHFAARAASRLGIPAIELTDNDLSLLVDYPWPGNVRELAAVMERAVILGDGKHLEVAKSLGSQPAMQNSGAESHLSPASTAATTEILPLDAAMARHIEAALARTQGRIEGIFGAARLLDINPHTLRGRMRSLGIEWKQFRPTSHTGR